MRKMKQLLASLLVIVFACSMLSVAALAEEAPAPAEAEAQAAETVAKADPVEGSWVLYQVYEVKEGAAPTLLKKEENQSLYGSGVGVYTFDNGGAAHHIMFDGGAGEDAEASWKVTEPNVYEYTEGSENMTLKYVESEDALHCSSALDGRNLDFVYARAMVGSWKLDKVTEVHDGDAPVDLPKEENQSLYGAGETILTFEPNGKATDETVDGSDKVVTEASWTLTGPDKFTYKVDPMEMEFSYFRADDTIIRDYKDETPDAAHPHLAFVYTRVFPEPKVEAETTKAAQNETKPTTKPATQPTTKKAEETTTEEELIADGKIFTGNKLTLYDPDDYSITMVVSELNQGGWADEETGIIYYQGAGGSEFFTGEDGSTWVVEAYFDHPEEEELINGGKIFTGFEMDMVDADTGAWILLKELSQGGYANEETGEIFTQEGGGGDHFYGDKGTVAIPVSMYESNDEIVDDVDDDVEVIVEDVDDSDYGEDEE